MQAIRSFPSQRRLKPCRRMGAAPGLVNRLKYHLKAGRLKPVCRGVYAVVPPAASVDRFLPILSSSQRPSSPMGVFSHHSALELLGVAHSMWQQCTLYVPKRRRPLALNGASVRFIEHPTRFRGRSGLLGVRKIERQGRLLHTTGPERTLVEGFSRPSLAGGSEELVRSAASFTVLDLDLLETVLKRTPSPISGRRPAGSWSASRKHSMSRMQYLPAWSAVAHGQSNTSSAAGVAGYWPRRWNLILPKEAFDLEEPGELLVEIR